ncbi:MAG: dephospho-CoA kinase [Akkermansiaceae bacterium]|nr:dephospho-CoA kinase [Armatimonadota bacterium]
MKILGITGGIACGKSFVTRLFAGWGARTASADADARTVVLPGSATLVTVLDAFPEARSPDGTLDRARLAARIFGDADARAKLEDILHPAIFAEMQRAINGARSVSDAPLFAYEVPLLFEKNRAAMFDATMAVVCSPETQAARLQERERTAGRPVLSAEQIAERLSAQLPNPEKARRANFVIHTDGSLEDTESQARAVWLAVVGSEPRGTAV